MTCIWVIGITPRPTWTKLNTPKKTTNFPLVIAANIGVNGSECFSLCSIAVMFVQCACSLYPYTCIIILTEENSNWLGSG